LYHAKFHLSRHILLPLRAKTVIWQNVEFVWAPIVSPSPIRTNLARKCRPVVYASVPNFIQVGYSVALKGRKTPNFHGDAT